MRLFVGCIKIRGAWVRLEQAHFGVLCYQSAGNKWIFEQQQNLVGSYKLNQPYRWGEVRCEFWEFSSVKMFILMPGAKDWFVLYICVTLKNPQPSFSSYLRSMSSSMEGLVYVRSTLWDYSLEIDIKSLAHIMIMCFTKLDHIFCETVIGALNDAATHTDGHF